MNRLCWLLFLILSMLQGYGQPPVQVWVNKQPISDTLTPIQVTGNQRLTIRLLVPAADTSQFTVRLDGVDEDWQTFRHQFSLSYVGSPGGTYTLLIKSATRPIRSLAQITIAPQLWQLWWFLPSLYLVAFLFLATALYFNYLHKLHQQVRMQHVRDRIARDLHDDMGSYLSSISIMSQTARRNAFRDPEKTQTALDAIGQTARQVIERMGDMVWSINPSHDSMADVLVRMTDVGNALFDDADVVFNLSVADDVRHMSLSAEVRREFFLIYKEAITNVARYAGANGIRVTLRREGAALAMTVQDNGCGFDTANPTYKNPGGGNGLGNMQARAKLINGILTIQSVPGEGTTVRLVVASG